MKDTLYIIIPAYNEEENIMSVINDWYPIAEELGKKSRLVIIDDGSTDHTFDIISEATQKRPKLIPIKKSNTGHGPTVLFGYKYACSHGADYVFQTDSDGQTLASEFKYFWNQRTRYDMVVGWRNKREDGKDRIFVTKVLKMVIKICCGVTITDANTPFRLISIKILKKYIDLIPDDSNLTNVLLSIIFAKKKCSVKYEPITFRSRQGGSNFINMKRIFKIGRKAVIDFRKMNKKLKKQG